MHRCIDSSVVHMIYRAMAMGDMTRRRLRLPYKSLIANMFTNQMARIPLAAPRHKRRIVAKHVCSYVTAKGETCGNTACLIYNEQHLCKRHLHCCKAKEECAICMEAMDNPSMRVKLACGHYFHRACIEKCIKPECPMCRQQMTADEASTMFIGRFKGLLARTFALPADDASRVFQLFERTVHIMETAELEGMHTWVSEDLFDLTTSFGAGVEIIVGLGECNDVSRCYMDSAIDVFHGSILHLDRHRAFTGFTVDGDRHNMYTGNIMPGPTGNIMPAPMVAAAAPEDHEIPMLIEAQANDLFVQDQGAYIV